MKTELKAAIAQLSAERNLPKDVVLGVLESALASAYKKDTGNLEQDVIAKVDASTGKISFYVQKTVVEEVENPSREFTVEEAQKVRASAQMGEVVFIECKPRDIGRIAAQAAKQVVLQRLREAEQRIVYEEFTNRAGEVVTGAIQYLEPRRIYVRLNRTEGVLPLEEQVPSEHYHRGQRLKFYLLEILEGGRGPQIVVSRSHPNLVRRLFEIEIPEVHSGLVELKAIAREAGHRTKVAVASSQENVDPVGSCLGPRGIRLQSIINELKGEKIDVIQWHSDPGIFIANALGPAQVAGTRVDEERRAATVVVPDKQLSLAIGKEGQNARLAAKLTGWRFDIRSVSAVEAERAVSEEPEPVEELPVPEIMEKDIFEEALVEEEPVEEEAVEEEVVEEPIDFAKLMEASVQTREEGQIRFAEEILRSSAKSDTSEKAKSGAKGKGKGGKPKKKTGGLWSEELDD